MLYVLWHKNPDTDAILSSILYAKFIERRWWEAKPVRLGELNNETKFVLETLWWSTPELVKTLPAGSFVALTDHNEKSQTIDNIDELHIQFIIDHHKCTIITNDPIEIVIKPIASTCSVIYWLWKAAGLEVTKDIARAMMMGIISDTLYFRSPTTTSYDTFIFDELQEYAQFENPEKLSLQMFDAKSNLGDISIRDLIMLDYKQFDAGTKKFGIGTIETTNPWYALFRKPEIIADLLNIKRESKLDMIMVSIVDILNGHNMSIIPSVEDGAIIQIVFGVQTDGNIADLGNRISRKKQIAWPLSDYLSSI